MEHEKSHWCWCRPKIEDAGSSNGRLMLILHRNVDPPHWMAERRFAGGEVYEDSGQAAEWRNIIP